MLRNIKDAICCLYYRCEYYLIPKDNALLGVQK